jgi:membrane associated rhomboid family serine protease
MSDPNWLGPKPDTGAAPPVREPVFNLPDVIMLLVSVLAAIHLGRLLLAVQADLEVLSTFSVVPARFALEFGWSDKQQIVRDLAAGLDPSAATEKLQLARYFVDGAEMRWWSVLSYALLHSGTTHIVMNCLWLAVFGSPLARRIGAVRFLLLFAVGSIAGAFAHIGTHVTDVVPLVGASAGVSAATGAAARFVFSRGLRMDSMSSDAAVQALPALSLSGMLWNRQALAFVVFWFATNWLFGAGVVTIAGENQGIAWEAHTGGFLAGLMLFPLLDRSVTRADPGAAAAH